MKYFAWIFLLLGSHAFAAEPAKAPALGIYSAFTEADWTVGFELKPAGAAIVTTEYGTDYDKSGKDIVHHKTVNGTWEFSAPYLTVTFDAFKDRFIQAHNCYENRPCFKYDSSQSPVGKKSPLNEPYEFVRHPGK